MKTIAELARKNILALAPYSSARSEHDCTPDDILLDANENPYNKPHNRYPDPLQRALKERISQIKGVPPQNIFVGNGSDEAIDLAYRCFAEPGRDNAVAIQPTYGMYKVCADINGVEYRDVPLGPGFSLDAGAVMEACDANTKIVWLCSPNNPTGNDLDPAAIEEILRGFGGIVVVDEAYCDFSSQEPLRKQLDLWPRLIVLNTMSKAWGMAGMRLGMAFAAVEVVELFNKAKYPYNISSLTQEAALKALADTHVVGEWTRMILQERGRVMDAFALLPFCRRVYPSAANFFLAEVDDPDATYQYLVGRGVIVRNRNSVALCAGCLRITIGSRSENSALLAALRQMP